METDELFATLQEKEQERALPSDACNKQIRAACTGDLKACQAMSAKTRSLASLGLLLFVGLSVLLLARQRLSGVTAAALWGATGWALIQVLVLVFGLTRQRGSSARVRVGLALLVPTAFFGYLTLIRSSTSSFSEFVQQPQQTQHAMHCGLFSFVIGSVAAVSIMLLWRRTDPFTPRITGSLAGLAGGLAAATPVGLVCPGTDGWHLCLAHGLSLVLVVALGAVLGRRWLSP
ncbi:MAG TPA: NrsF family protein [Polyangiaceae bacterium]|nr:NrsF family protein [Polyangiaceae bacterium]